jgi:hypothetical protein
MKMTTMTILLFLSLQLFAPSNYVVTIVEPEPIQPFKQLIYAVGKVECDFDTLSYNPIEEATGYFQIRPIRLNDYNKRTRSKYVLRDMYDYQIAEKVFLYYAMDIGPYNFEKIAKKWNGSGPMTIKYWDKVKLYL